MISGSLAPAHEGQEATVYSGVDLKPYLPQGLFNDTYHGGGQKV